MTEAGLKERTAVEAVKRHAEQVALDCSVQTSDSGEPFLTLNAQHFPSWPNVHFGLRFRPGTTPEQAEVFAAQLQELCPAMYFQWFDHGLEGLPLYDAIKTAGRYLTSR
jgi:hypothetical protein